MKELHIDWGDGDTEIREAIDFAVSRTPLPRTADNAQCGWLMKTGDEEELAQTIRRFASALNRAAESLEENQQKDGGDTE